MWSCGVLLYEVAVGALPFADNRSSFRASFQIPAFVPITARDVVSKLLRLDPAWRARAEDLLQYAFFADKSGAAGCCTFANIAPTETDSQGRARAETMALRTPPAGGRIQGSLSAVAAAAVATAGAAATAQAPVTPSPANPLTPPARPAMSPAVPSLSASLTNTMLTGATASCGSQTNGSNHQRQQQSEQTQPPVVSLASPSPSFRTRIIGPPTPGPTARGILATPANPVVTGTPTAPPGRMVQAGFSWASQASPHRAANSEARAAERPAPNATAATGSPCSGSLILKVRGPAQAPTAVTDAFLSASRTRSITPMGRRPGDLTPQPGLARSAVATTASPNLHRPKQIPKAPAGYFGPQRLVSMPATPLHYGFVASGGTSITLAPASQQRFTHCVTGLLGQSTVSVATAKSAGA